MAGPANREKCQTLNGAVFQAFTNVGLKGTKHADQDEDVVRATGCNPAGRDGLRLPGLGLDAGTIGATEDTGGQGGDRDVPPDVAVSYLPLCRGRHTIHTGQLF